MIVAFSIQLFNSPDGMAFSAWKNGYAIAMTFDGKWPFQFIALAPPPAFDAFVKNELGEFDIELGLSSLTMRDDMGNLVLNGASWTSVFPNERWDVIAGHDIGLIFHIVAASEIETWDLAILSKANRTILSIQGDASFDAEATMLRVAEIRAEWQRRVPDLVPRILISTGIVLDRQQDFSPLTDFVSRLSGIDGIFLADVPPPYVADVCSHLSKMTAG